MVEWRRCGRRVGGRARGRLPGAVSSRSRGQTPVPPPCKQCLGLSKLFVIFHPSGKHTRTTRRAEGRRAAQLGRLRCRRDGTDAHATESTPCVRGGGACHPPTSAPFSPAQLSGQSTGGGWAAHPGKKVDVLAVRRRASGEGRLAQVPFGKILPDLRVASATVPDLWVGRGSCALAGCELDRHRRCLLASSCARVREWRGATRAGKLPGPHPSPSPLSPAIALTTTVTPTLTLTLTTLTTLTTRALAPRPHPRLSHMR